MSIIFRMAALDSKVTIIPITQPFLQVLAQRFYQRFRKDLPDLSDLLIIFPSQRNKFYFRRYLLEASNNRGVIPPTMKTISELTEEIYILLGGKKGMLLNMVERNFILKKSVDSLKIEFWRDLPFLKFISIGGRLLQFYDELAKERITIDEIEQRVLAGHYPERYIKNELTIIKKVNVEYRKTLRELGYQDEVDKYDTVWNHFDPKLLNQYRYIGIAGLAAPLTIENKIIKEVLENLNAELILHSGNPGALRDSSDIDKPYYLHNTLLTSLGVDLSRIETTARPPLPPPVFHVKGVESEAHQTLYLKDILTRLKNLYDPHRICIVVIDENNVYPITESLASAGIEFNLSTGFSLTQSILYSFLNQLKAVIDVDCHFKEFFAFIKHPLFKNAKVGNTPLRHLIYQLQRQMISGQINYFDPRYHSDETLKPLIQLIMYCIDTARGEANQSLCGYIDKLIKMFNTLLLSNKELIGVNRSDVGEFLESLNRLRKLRIRERLKDSGIDLLDFILRVLRDDTYNIQGEPMKGVQVIGLLEARNLDFDCIILPSMNEGIFPKRSEKDLFINQTVRREIGLPYDKKRENLYYYYFNELTNGKKEVYLSYVEEEKRDIRSRFIDFLAAQGVLVDTSRIPLHTASLKPPARKVKKEKTMLGILYRNLTGRGLSPTALKDYKECPYRFYIKYLLNIQEPREIVEEAGALEWGAIIHGALNNFYKYDFSDGVRENELARAHNLLSKRLEDAIKGKLATRPRGVTFLDLNIYKRRMYTFLEYEIERFKSGYRIDIGKLEKRLQHHITVNNTKIKLVGYTDRIDVADGQYYIIDYKSSPPAKEKYQISDGFVEFQLPLYALILSEENYERIGGMAYYIIAKNIKFIDIVEKDGILGYLKSFKDEILLPTVREILDPSVDFYQTAKQDACNYCSYAGLCGVKDAARY